MVPKVSNSVLNIVLVGFCNVKHVCCYHFFTRVLYVPHCLLLSFIRFSPFVNLICLFRGVKWAVWLELRMLNWVELEIRLGYDPPKLTLSSKGFGSNGQKFRLGRDLFNFNILLFTFYN